MRQGPRSQPTTSKGTSDASAMLAATPDTRSAWSSGRPHLDATVVRGTTRSSAARWPRYRSAVGGERDCDSGRPRRRGAVETAPGGSANRSRSPTRMTWKISPTRWTARCAHRPGASPCGSRGRSTLRHDRLARDRRPHADDRL
jgi:hypothetical protein